MVIALWSSHDPHHQRARELLSGLVRQPIWMHAVTVAEVLVGPARLGRADDAVDALSTLGVRTVPLREGDPVTLARERARTGLRLPDCCVLLAARQSQASLATFDAALGLAAVARGILVVG